MEAVKSLSWNTGDSPVPIVRRAMLVRQYDSLVAITWMVKRHLGYATVPLLRPACEELLWAKYLRRINGDQAATLISCNLAQEVLRTLKAQEAYWGSAANAALGLGPAFELYSSLQPQARLELTALGKALRWPQRAVGEGRPPSARYLAEQTDSVALYEFLYHATSQFVHYSPHQLLRRVWGQPGALTIQSSHVEEYYGAFALKWGTHLFMETLLSVQDSLPSDVDADYKKALDTMRRLYDSAPVIIIGPEELHWPMLPP